MKNTKNTQKASAAVAKKSISQSTLAIIITAAILVVALLSTTVFLIVDAVRNDTGFDYFKSNLSKYVEIDAEDYDNIKLTIDYAKAKEIDVDTAMLGLVSSDRGKAVDGGVFSQKYTVYPGDVVQLWYRGYILDDEGNEIEVDGLSNFKNSDASSVTVGSGSIASGFDLGLVGKSAMGSARFEKITTGKTSADQIVYVTYKRNAKPVDGTTSAIESASYARIDLSDAEAVDAKYGEGFYDKILGAVINSTTALTFETTINDTEYEYTEIKINFATTCEKAENVITIDCYFPYDYGQDGYASANLRNENVHFDIYIKYVQHYELAEGVEWDEENNTYVITDEYIRGKLEDEDSVVTEEDINEYEGANLVEKYRSYVWELIEEANKEDYDEIVQAALWDYLFESAKIKKYPLSKVDEIHKEYINDVQRQFLITGGQVQDSYTGSVTTYDNIEKFAVAYLGLTYSSNQDWRAVLYETAENLVAERLVLYYLVRNIDGLMPTDAEVRQKKAELKDEYLEAYIKQYLKSNDMKKKDFSDEEYEEFVEERSREIFSYYDDDFFTESAYYETATEGLLSIAEISTLDDRRDYPFEK